MGSGASSGLMPSLRAVYEAKKELSDDELWAALSDCIKPKVTDAQKEAITKVVSELKAGEKGDFSMCTEDAVFLVPGAPAPMPVAMVAGMCGAMQAAMTWDNSTKFEIETAEIDADGNTVVAAKTQQRLGVMTADLPAIGPFPAVSLAEASDKCKETPCILPWEYGKYYFNAAGKISKVLYDGATAPTDDDSNATTLEYTPTTGFPSVYAHMGVALPPPPPSSTFFIIHHDFKEDGAADKFWAMMGGMSPEDQKANGEKNLSLGMWNHSFMPTGPQGPCFCVWEAKGECSNEQFQAFIDGPDGPGAGAIFNNTVRSMPAALIGTNTPYPAKF
jgi:hypothetical protein